MLLLYLRLFVRRRPLLTDGDQNLRAQTRLTLFRQQIIAVSRHWHWWGDDTHADRVEQALSRVGQRVTLAQPMW
jgi:hypothetical protein